MTRTIRVTVNGREHERAVEVRQTLADFLREDLELTGTHVAGVLTRRALARAAERAAGGGAQTTGAGAHEKGPRR